MGLFKRRAKQDAGGLAVRERRPDLSDGYPGEHRRAAAPRSSGSPRPTAPAASWSASGGCCGCATTPASGRSRRRSTAPASPTRTPARLPARGCPRSAPRTSRPGSYARGSCATVLLVRGLVERAEAQRFAEHDRPLVRGPRAAAVRSDGHYDEFDPPSAFPVASVRPWIQDGGGVLATDAPRAAFAMLELFDGRRRARGSSASYLGETAAALGPQDDAAQGRPGGRRRVAPGRRVHGRRPRAQPLALALALRRRGARASTSSRADSTDVVIEHDEMLDVELTREARPRGGRRRRHRPPDLRAGRRAVLRRAVPAPDGLRSGDAEPALRDRELVLRRLRVPARLRPDRGLSAPRTPAPRA